MLYWENRGIRILKNYGGKWKRKVCGWYKGRMDLREGIGKDGLGEQEELRDLARRVGFRGSKRQWVGQ